MKKFMICAVAFMIIFSLNAFAAPLGVGTADLEAWNSKSFSTPYMEPLQTSYSREVFLGDATTTYSTASSYANRNVNMQLAAEFINGKIIMPYETFSYNETVGPRTAQRGFREATIFVGEEKEQGLGGGICQVSSTTYMAAKKTNLVIVERHQHSLPVSYCSEDDEATVSWGYLDLKLRNDNEYPIRINASVSRGRVYVKFTGLI